MLTPQQVRSMVLTMPVLEEIVHLNHTDFRIREKTFAALWPIPNWINLKVGKEEQYMLASQAHMFSIPKEGARGGWITARLGAVREQDLLEAIWKAWRNTAGPKMSARY